MKRRSTARRRAVGWKDEWSSVLQVAAHKRRRSSLDAVTALSISITSTLLLRSAISIAQRAMEDAGESKPNVVLSCHF